LGSCIKRNSQFEESAAKQILSVTLGIICSRNLSIEALEDVEINGAEHQARKWIKKIFSIY
jgi:hypothetical protein